MEKLRKMQRIEAAQLFSIPFVILSAAKDLLLTEPHGIHRFAQNDRHNSVFNILKNRRYFLSLTRPCAEGPEKPMFCLQNH
jgi:hypothetical protein